jgi:hypothetical protein
VRSERKRKPAEQPALKTVQAMDRPEDVIANRRNRYELTVQEAQQEESLDRKILVWEEYVESRPDSVDLFRAMVNLSGLYMLRAQQDTSRVRIESAIDYYQSAKKMLGPGFHDEKLDRMEETLRQRLKQMDQ